MPLDGQLSSTHGIHVQLYRKIVLFAKALHEHRFEHTLNAVTIRHATCVPGDFTGMCARGHILTPACGSLASSPASQRQMSENIFIVL